MFDTHSVRAYPVSTRTERRCTVTCMVIRGKFIETGSRVLVRFSFSSADPVAVKMEVFHGDQAGVDWQLGRELLHEGYRHGSGLGDVRIRVHSFGKLHMTLSSPDGTATLELPRWLVRSFLVDTYHIIPRRHKRAKRCDDAPLPTPRRNAREAEIIENAIESFLAGLPTH